MGKSRSGPREPSRSGALVGETKFTNGADKGRVVLPKSERAFSAVIVNAEALCLVGMGFGDGQASAQSVACGSLAPATSVR